MEPSPCQYCPTGVSGLARYVLCQNETTLPFLQIQFTGQRKLMLKTYWPLVPMVS